ncbi:DUF3320 domain-containing protein [Pseudonocardia lacus]|uniref:DUF3320 domain-containing protein n=1 Tax=Pseudonocardia lacus TaxID=2835865 RepID=UPI001BDD5700|nr:DUF3320 domain-containing protein [Pseudonocardia lacus]
MPKTSAEIGYLGGGRHVGEGSTDAQRRQLVRDAIASWRDGLVNLSASNRLLNFRPRKTSAVRIVGPNSSEVVRGLSAGTVFSFRGPVVDMTKEPEPPAAAVGRGRRRLVTLRTESGGKDLTGALRNLLKRATQEYLDRGLRILYLAVGSLEWTDAAGQAYSSPLLLIPVELVGNGPRELPYLKAAEEDPVLNPALALKLADSDVRLPTLDDLDDIDPENVLGRFRSAVTRRRGWRVDDALVLSYFTFAKEAMYRDLLDNEARIAEHAGVTALASGGRGIEVPDFGFDELRDEDVDERAPAHATPLVLDADSSQRACIAAAVDGRSFVMDGPPGTGKSQTIANVIGALLHAGRTVLFVSEKAAALDVVRNRLTEVGLGAFLLELHSSKVTRKEVAAELGRALDSRPVAPAGMSAMEVDQLRRRQVELNRYAAAMNEPRAELGASLHTVIGWVSQRAEVPTAPATGRPVAGLTPQLLGEIRHHASTLSQAWRPALEGASYVWRDVRHAGAMVSRLQAAQRDLTDLDDILQVNRPVLDAFELSGPKDADELATLLEHYATRPLDVPDHWLTQLSEDQLDEAEKRLHHQVEALRAQRRLAGEAAGISWSDIPSPDALAGLDLRRLDGLRPAPLPVDDLTVTVMDDLFARFTDDIATLRTARAELDDIAALLRLPAPETFDHADALLAVAAVAAEADRPEARWLAPHGADAATAALNHLGAVVAALDAAEASARRYFTDAALESDAAGLDERFCTQHTGMRRWSGAYRKDKAAVVAITNEGVSFADARGQLGLVVAWQAATAALDAAAPAHARDLGAYYAGRATDATRAAGAIERARSIVRRYPLPDLSGVAAQVGHGAVPAPALAHLTRSAAGALSGWRAALGRVVDVGPGPQLSTGSLAAAVSWLDEHRVVLPMARDAVRRVDDATGRRCTAREARRILGLRLAADRAGSELAAAAERHQAACGALYRGEQTDLEALRAAARWARAMRKLAGSALVPSQVHALAASVKVEALRAASTQWQASRRAVVEAFEPARHQDLLAELDDVADAHDLLAALLEDSAGQDEWAAFRDSRDALRQLGVAESVEFCMREQLPAEQVPAVVEKAVLTEWVDHQIATDRALRTVRSQARDSLVAEFRELDRRVVTTAVGSIIDACNGRRPRTVVGQAAVIRRESEKTRKHMPVRELIQRSRDVAQAIKPCFMMSPLAVSQYLPADLVFDVVIFDEASQVAPMDAINCIYRGRSLIVAGDAKQLPPTSFFKLAGDDGDEWTDEADDAKDFESVLDLAKSSGAYRSLTLKWHYRSRHESLIAFSNAKFYDGKLITFPGAEHEGPDVGVELVPVAGVYRRGSTRDNPIEARKVAELVMHHYSTRPGRSVGVVTFSEAQATAVEAAVEEARRERPELDEHFAESRLDGFFVKNLESVQGDERDVMIFSLGYGPDEVGKTTMNFGPLNRAGGWRRLNVAITRARYRNEVVTSLRAGDITPGASSEGLRHLRNYLDFAERGVAALALDTPTGGDAESPFEESVISAIRSRGYDVTPQVGAADYRIDMAVHHPGHPGVFVLGVECDGVQYHSSRVARDRDRLRDQVLTGLGWTMHRIWGTAWYRDRQGAEQRLFAAIEAAVQAPVRGLLGGGTGGATNRGPVVELEAVEFAATPDWAVPYAMAEIGRRPRWTEPHELAVVSAMSTAVSAIVDLEGPVHLEVVYQRFRKAWNIGQIGSRIRENIDIAVQRSGVVRDGNFLHKPGADAVRVRTPVDGCRRAVDQIHSVELELALLSLVRDAGGIAYGDATTHAARLFGWNRRGPDIMKRLEALLDQLVNAGRMSLVGEELSVAGLINTPTPLGGRRVVLLRRGKQR